MENFIFCAVIFFSIFNFFDSSCLLKKLSLSLSYRSLYLILFHFSTWSCFHHGSSWKIGGNGFFKVLFGKVLMQLVFLNVLEKQIHEKSFQLASVLQSFQYKVFRPVENCQKKCWKFIITILLYGDFAFLGPLSEKKLEKTPSLSWIETSVS